MIYLFRSKATFSGLSILGSTKKIADITHNGNKLMLRNMSCAELESTRINWAKKEGWSSMRYATAATYSLDQQGFYLLEDGQEKLASISVVNYPAISTAYVGFYIVPIEHRRKGYGKLIFDQALKHAHTRGITSIGLDCLPNMQEMYSSWGFKTIGIDDLWKYTMPRDYLDSRQTITYMEITSITDLFNKLVAYDTTVFGSNRAEYLNLHCNKPTTATAIYMENNQILGYGVISEREPAKEEPNKSYRIGPLYADNFETATEILTKMLESVELQPEQQVFVETPGNNEAVTALLNHFNFNKFCSMHRMFKGELPNHDIPKTFAYSSLATG